MSYEPTRIEIDECIEEARQLPHDTLLLLFAMTAGALKYSTVNSPPQVDKYVEDALQKIKNLLTKEEVEKIEAIANKHAEML